MSGEDQTESANEYRLPLPSRYFDREFIRSVPLDEGVDGLVKWLSDHVGEAVTKFDNVTNRDAEESTHTVHAIWRYVDAKDMDFDARINPSDEPAQSLSPEMEQTARQMNRETRLAFNASFRAGQLNMGKNMLIALGLEREAVVNDKLFERAESTSGMVVVPAAGRLPSSKS